MRTTLEYETRRFPAVRLRRPGAGRDRHAVSVEMNRHAAVKTSQFVRDRVANRLQRVLDRDLSARNRAPSRS